MDGDAIGTTVTVLYRQGGLSSGVAIKRGSTVARYFSGVGMKIKLGGPSEGKRPMQSRGVWGMPPKENFEF